MYILFRRPQAHAAAALGAPTLRTVQAPTLRTAMNAKLMIWPALALMVWTMLVLVQVPIRRFNAAFKHRVVAKDFEIGESANVPADIALPNRAFMNLVEVPVLFYALVAFYLLTGNASTLALALAWLYLALRIAHSLIYLTYNNVVHRFAVFAASNLVVLAMVAHLGKSLL